MTLGPGSSVPVPPKCPGHHILGHSKGEVGRINRPQRASFPDTSLSILKTDLKDLNWVLFLVFCFSISRAR